MSKIILIIAAVLLVGSAALGYLNNSKMKAKVADLATSQTVATTAQSDAAKAKSAQKKAEKDASDAVAKTTEMQSQLTAVSNETSDLKTKIATATSDLGAKDTEINELKAKLAATPAATTTGAMPPEIAQQLDTLKHARDELQVVKDGLDTQLKSTQIQVASLQKRMADRDSGALMNGLRGRVLAVDRNWNFVVLDLGNRNGVNVNAMMVVQHGGSMVGRVRITTVEPSQSIADIVPNSVPAGISVQPGDMVVFPGS